MKETFPFGQKFFCQFLITLLLRLWQNYALHNSGSENESQAEQFLNGFIPEWCPVSISLLSFKSQNVFECCWLLRSPTCCCKHLEREENILMIRWYFLLLSARLEIPPVVRNTLAKSVCTCRPVKLQLRFSFVLTLHNVKKQSDVYWPVTLYQCQTKTVWETAILHYSSNRMSS